MVILQLDFLYRTKSRYTGADQKKRKDYWKKKAADKTAALHRINMKSIFFCCCCSFSFSVVALNGPVHHSLQPKIESKGKQPLFSANCHTTLSIFDYFVFNVLFFDYCLYYKEGCVDAFIYIESSI